VLASEAALFTYEADALAIEKRVPEVVVLPRSTDEVAAVVRWAHGRGVAVTPRGAGTGLAGGATPERGGIVLSLNRMADVRRVDPERMLAWVEPGLVNLSLSQQLARHGLYYAPDPASQQVSTIGGNVATNAGGPHCLKYGVTVQPRAGRVSRCHDGTIVTLGGEAPDSPTSIASVITGERGHARDRDRDLRAAAAARAVKTMLFDFVTVEESCRTVPPRSRRDRPHRDGDLRTATPPGWSRRGSTSGSR
jgi:glycolate oxidase